MRNAEPFLESDRTEHREGTGNASFLKYGFGLSRQDTPLESGHLRRAFRLALKQARIEEFHFHDLRHTFATRLVQAGIDLCKEQQLLGHKSPIMRQRYAHHYLGRLWDGWDGVEILDRPRESSTVLAQSAG